MRIVKFVLCALQLVRQALKDLPSAVGAYIVRHDVGGMDVVRDQTVRAKVQEVDLGRGHLAAIAALADRLVEHLSDPLAGRAERLAKTGLVEGWRRLTASPVCKGLRARIFAVFVDFPKGQVAGLLVVVGFQQDVAGFRNVRAAFRLRLVRPRLVRKGIVPVGGLTVLQEVVDDALACGIAEAEGIARRLWYVECVIKIFANAPPAPRCYFCFGELAKLRNRRRCQETRAIARP